MRRPRIRLNAARPNLTHGLMVLAALLTFIAVSTALKDRRATVEVLVASSDLERGQVVGSSDFVAVAIPTSTAALHSWMTPADQPVGQLVRDLVGGEPLLRSDLDAVQNGRASRTFSVPVEDRVLQGLGLVVGDRVDLVGVGRDGPPSFVVGGVRVARLPAPSTGSSLRGRLGSAFVTVEVNERQVLALVAALRIDAVDVVRSTGAKPVSRLQAVAQ